MSLQFEFFVIRPKKNVISSGSPVHLPQALGSNKSLRILVLSFLGGARIGFCTGVSDTKLAKSLSQLDN